MDITMSIFRYSELVVTTINVYQNTKGGSHTNGKMSFRTVIGHLGYKGDTDHITWKEQGGKIQRRRIFVKIWKLSCQWQRWKEFQAASSRTSRGRFKCLE
jgi:hypothetical protein